MSKVCINCQVSLEGYHGNAKYCMPCSAEATLAKSRRWKARNKEQVVEYAKQWRIDNPDKVKANNDSWYEENAQYKCEQRKQYYIDNREAELAKSKARYSEKPECLYLVAGLIRTITFSYCVFLVTVVSQLRTTRNLFYIKS